MSRELAITFECNDASLLGILNLPEQPVKKGVLIVVGGPQYRVGSHRQFVLLARHLAHRHIAVFRFDHRGIGDSEGTFTSFLNLNDDIRSAMDTFCAECPNLESIYIWGLCDAASAALMYGKRDSRVSGLVLLNPWVRTDASLAKAYIDSYYKKRLSDINFWKDLIAGRIDLASAGKSFWTNVTTMLSRKTAISETAGDLPKENDEDENFPRQMLIGFQEFSGSILIIMSENDLTAREFRNLIISNADWKQAVKGRRVTWFDVPGSNHTFARQEWRHMVEDKTASWINSL